jgi:hypothetical protein
MSSTPTSSRLGYRADLTAHTSLRTYVLEVTPCLLTTF